MGRRLGPWLALALGLAAAPWLFPSDFALTLLTQAATLAIITLSFNLLFGSTGLLSFGHAVHVGLGGYLTAHLLNAATQGALPFAVPVPLLPLAGALGGAASAWLVAALVARQSGTGFAMITLAIGEMVAAAAFMFPGFFGGEAGIRIDRTAGGPWLGWTFATPAQVYGLAAAWLFVSVLVLRGLTATPLGRLANAVRDNASRVACLGFDPAGIRRAQLILAGAFAGIGGALAAINFEIVNAESVGTVRSGTYLLFTVLGGTQHFFGPVAGALAAAVSMVLLSGWTKAWLFYLGLAFLVVTLSGRDGIAGILATHWRALRHGHWPVLWRPWSLAAGTWLGATAGLVALVEMAYRWRFETGAAWRIGPWSLDPAVPMPWVVALALLVGGAVLARRATRLLRTAAAAAESASAQPEPRS